MPGPTTDSYNRPTPTKPCNIGFFNFDLAESSARDQGQPSLVPPHLSTIIYYTSFDTLHSGATPVSANLASVVPTYIGNHPHVFFWVHWLHTSFCQNRDLSSIYPISLRYTSLSRRKRYCPHSFCSLAISKCTNVRHNIILQRVVCRRRVPEMYNVSIYRN